MSGAHSTNVFFSRFADVRRDPAIVARPVAHSRPARGIDSVSR
jgi:hypothetical protein